MSPVRVALFAILGVLVVVLVFEMMARLPAQAAHSRLSRYVHTEETGPIPQAVTDPPSPEDVRKLLGREPDGPADLRERELVETYTWRGPLRKYTVYVCFQRGSKPLLYKVSLNDPL
jgi:hypothetical protein